MKLGDYIEKRADINTKIGELNGLMEEAYGYAKTTLQYEVDKLEAELTKLDALDMAPMASVVDLAVTFAAPSTVGAQADIDVVATLNDTTTRNVSKAQFATAGFADPDTVRNNVGKFTDVNVSGYTGGNGTILVTKTANGLDVIDKTFHEAGLHTQSMGANHYAILDVTGTHFGIEFKTDGNEDTKDNWEITVEQRPTGTTYESSDEAVATVDANGKVTGVATGTATITIKNNNVVKTESVTIS